MIPLIVAPGPAEVLVLMVLASIFVIPMWMICSKAGYPGWISLIALVPVMGIALLYFLALANWPALNESTQASRSDSQAS